MDPARKSSLPRGYGVIWSTVAIDLIGFGIVAPLLPLYAERFGASGFTVGLLFASFSLAQFVCAPLLGRLSDRIGRKPVILLSLFGTALGCLLTGAANSLPLLFAGRILDGASGASVSVAQGAVSDLASPEDRPRLLGMLGAAFGVGFVLGPAIGGLAALGGAHVPFYVAAVIAAVNGVVAIVRLPETHSPHTHADADVAVNDLGHGVSTEFGSPLGTRLVRLAAVWFLSTFAFSAFETTFSLFANERFSLDESEVAWVFVGIGVMLVIVQGGLIGRVSKQFGVRSTLQRAIVINAAGLAVLAAATSWWVLVPSLMLLTLGQGLTVPSVSSLVVEWAPMRRRGEALGFNQSASALARVLGPAAGGLLFDHAGLAWPYVMGCVVLALAAVLLVAIPHGNEVGAEVTSR